MKKGLFFVILLALLYVPFASASITLPTFDKAYNLGDTLTAKASVEQSQDLEGFFKLDIQCANSSNNFFSLPIQLKANVLKSIDVPSISLKKTGDCLILARLEDSSNNLIEEKTSDGFSVSDSIKVELSGIKETYSPGEKIKIEGSAINSNGKDAEGNAIITIDMAYTAKVSGGRFSYEDNLPKKMKSGEHLIKVRVEDKEGNFGEAEETIVVKQIPTSVSLSVSKNAINPGDKIVADAVLLDQADDPINEDLILTLYNSWGAEVQRKTVGSNETFEYQGKSSDSPGNWWIYAYSENLKARKFIYVNELKNVDIIVSGNQLNVTNIGNVVYNGPITVVFIKGDERKEQVIEINLGVGKSESFGLEGNGEYRIEVKTDEFDRKFDLVSLTGSSVGVRSSQNPWRLIMAGIFVLLIIVSAGFLQLRKKKQINIKETVTVNQNRI